MRRSFCLGVAAAAAFLTLAGPAARAGMPLRPGEIDIKDVDPDKFKAEDIFRIRFPAKMHTARGALAKCKTCGKPLCEHVDGKLDCRAPNSRTAELGKARARCPVCRLEFAAPKPDPDPRGGIDHDFCRHPRGVYSFASEIRLCPRCGYAAAFDEFASPVDEETREFVRSTVTPGTTKFLDAIVGFKPKSFKFEDYSFLDTAYIPEHFKYENALAIAGARDLGDLAIARLHLGASHAYRRLVNRPFRERGLDRAIRRVEAMLVDPMSVDNTDPVSVASAARRILRRADAKDALPTEKLRRRERLYLVMRLAGLHDRLGEPWWADHHLRQAWELALKENEPKVRHAYVGLVRNIAEFLKREAHHRGRAAARYRRALASGKVPPNELLVATYLVGELLARLGDLRRARPWLEEGARLAAGSTGAGEAGPLLEGWARFRLSSPAFIEGKGAGRRAIAADPEERRIVMQVAAGLPVELSREAPAGTPAGPPEATTASAPGESTPQPGAAAAPSVVPATQPRRGASPVAAADKSPANCRAQMERIWQAVDAYRRARGEFPLKLDALVRAGLVSRAEAGEFVCADTGAKLFYRAPRSGAGVTFILFHSSPGSCLCKNMLLSDGQVVEFGKWQP